MLDKNTLKSLILEQKKLQMEAPVGIPRDAFEDIEPHLALPHALVIAGPRRAGKSTLLLQIMEKIYDWDVYYFNLEDERLIGFTALDFNALYETMIELYGEKTVFCLDEIQNIPEWERFVRRLQNQNMKFIITGSNASLLSKELGTKLTGRHIQIELLPYSFKEYLRYQQIQYTPDAFFQTSERAILKKHFQQFMKMGGIPEYVTYESPQVLTTLYENVIYKDIVVRYEIHAIRAFRELALYLMNNAGTLLSYTKLKNTLELGSINTVKNFIHYLENAYLIFTIGGFAYSVKKRLLSQKKVYCIDTGMMSTVSLQFSQNTGKYLENIVFLELRRRYKTIHYYKTENNLEVDFIVEDAQGQWHLFQVCETMAQQQTKNREIRALTTAALELKLNQGMILTLDEADELNQDNCLITVKPVYQWLLE